MTHIGLLGAARIAPKAIIAPAAKRNDCEIVAVGCRNREKGLQFTIDNQLTADVVNYSEICTDPHIEAVYLALPPSEHAQWACLAMENGKAVLCEKPAAMGAEDAKQMAEASRRTGRFFMEAFHYFYHPAFQNFLSEMQHVFEPQDRFNFEACFTASIPNKEGELRYRPELGGGALMDLGCYALHALRQLFGEMSIERVTADIEGGVDIALTAHLTSERGQGVLSCNMREGSVREDYIRADTTSGGKANFLNFVAPYRGFNSLLSNAEKRVEQAQSVTELTTYDYQLAHFLEVLRGGKALLEVTDVTAQAKAMDAIYKEVGLR